MNSRVIGKQVLHSFNSSFLSFYVFILSTFLTFIPSPISKVIPIGSDLAKYREWVKLLKKNHDRHFLVWNFTDPSKRRFETKDFDEQVAIP